MICFLIFIFKYIQPLLCLFYLIHESNKKLHHFLLINLRLEKMFNELNKNGRVSKENQT